MIRKPQSGQCSEPCVSMFYVIDTGSTGSVLGAHLGIACPPSALSLTLAVPTSADLPLTILGVPVSIGPGCVEILFQGHRAKPFTGLNRRAPKGRPTWNTLPPSLPPRIPRRPGGLSIRAQCCCPDQLRPELVPGSGVLPGPATGSHIVNRGTPVAPLGQPSRS